MYYIPEIHRFVSDVNPKYKSVEEAREKGKGNLYSKILLVYPLTEDGHYDRLNMFYVISSEAEYIYNK